MDEDRSQMLSRNSLVLFQPINYFCVLSICIPYLVFFFVLSFAPLILSKKIFSWTCLSLGMLYGIGLILLSILLTAVRCFLV